MRHTSGELTARWGSYAGTGIDEYSGTPRSAWRRGSPPSGPLSAPSLSDRVRSFAAPPDLLSRRRGCVSARAPGPRPVSAPWDPTVRLGWRARSPTHGHRGPRARHHPDHRVGDELLLPWRPRGADRQGHRLEPGLRVPRFHRRFARHGPRLERGGPRHRSPRRPRGDDARHRARVGRPVRARPCPERAAYLGSLGLPRPRHAPVPVRAAFAALVQVAPSRGRKAISYLTLFGAFASSVFWVVGHALEEQVGWRQTLVLFALINLVVCLPLHWLGLARRERAGHRRRPRPPPQRLRTGLRSRGGRARSLSALRADHVAQRVHVRRHLGAARADARGRGPGHGDRGVGRLDEGRGAVRRAGGRDHLRAQSPGDLRRPDRRRRAAPLAAPAARGPGACRSSSRSRCSWAPPRASSPSSVARCRSRCSAPRAMARCSGHRHSGARRQCRAPTAVRLDRGPLGLGDRA